MDNLYRPVNPEDIPKMALNDVFKLVLKSNQGVVEINNIFHYRQTFGVTGGSILAQEFINEVFPAIQSVVSDQVTFVGVEYLNYDDNSDFGIDASIAGETGDRPGEPLPTFNAWGFQYNRETRDTRNGSKRFSPISELDQAYGSPTAPMLTVLQACASSLGQYINIGGTEIWQPVIARLTPDGSTVLLTNDVKNVTYTRLTSQVSRKR